MARVKVVESLIVSDDVSVTVFVELNVRVNSGPRVIVSMVVVSEVVPTGMVTVPVFGMITLLMITLVVVVVVVEKNM